MTPNAGVSAQPHCSAPAADTAGVPPAADMHRPSQTQETVSLAVSLSHQYTASVATFVIGSSHSLFQDYAVEHPALSMVSWTLGLGRISPMRTFMILPLNDHLDPLALAPGDHDQAACPSADSVSEEPSVPSAQPHSYGVSGRTVWSLQAHCHSRRVHYYHIHFPTSISNELHVFFSKYVFQLFAIWQKLIENTRVIGQRR